MPGSSPRCAMSRKRTREMPNLLRFPRGRPSTASRLRTRIGEASRGSFCRPTRAASRDSSVPFGSTRAFLSSRRLAAQRSTITLRCSFLAILDVLAMWLALLSEVDVLAHYGVVLLEHETVGVVTTVLAGHVGVPGACRRTELDDGTDVLLLRH